MSTLTAVAELLAPRRCLACGVRAARPWCGWCAREAAGSRTGPACDRCALPGADGDHACWPPRLPVLSTVAAFRYTGAVARTVIAGKTRGARTAWRPLGRLLGGVVAGSTVAIDAVTWVPGDRRRLRWRGYDHAGLLALGVADRLDRPAVPLLAASGARRDQAALAPRSRRALPPGAFRPIGRPEGRRLLLVDDVMTTGATIRAAALVLASAGARPLRVAVLARAGRHDLT